jgi:plasmid stability protein
MQYTVRSVPKSVDEALRRRARTEGRSLNEVAIEALAKGLGLGAEPVIQRDLSDIAGTWKRDATIEAGLAAQDEVDETLWK